MLLERHSEAKCGRCRKIRNCTAAGFAGLSERRILSVTNSELKYRLHNAKFANKDVPRPATAKHVQSQYQVDVVALINDPVKHNVEVYKYVGSVTDIFSRFVWLRPLKKRQAAVWLCFFHPYTPNMAHRIICKVIVVRSSWES